MGIRDGSADSAESAIAATASSSNAGRAECREISMVPISRNLVVASKKQTKKFSQAALFQVVPTHSALAAADPISADLCDNPNNPNRCSSVHEKFYSTNPEVKKQLSQILYYAGVFAFAAYSTSGKGPSPSADLPSDFSRNWISVRIDESDSYWLYKATDLNVEFRGLWCLAIRGTKCWSELKADFALIHETLDETNTSFTEAAKIIMRSLWTLLVENEVPLNKLIVTGHSFGGSIAEVFYAILRKTWEDLILEKIVTDDFWYSACISFESPGQSPQCRIIFMRCKYRDAKIKGMYTLNGAVNVINSLHRSAACRLLVVNGGSNLSPSSLRKSIPSGVDALFSMCEEQVRRHEMRALLFALSREEYQVHSIESWPELAPTLKTSFNTVANWVKNAAEYIEYKLSRNTTEKVFTQARTLQHQLERLIKTLNSSDEPDSQAKVNLMTRICTYINEYLEHWWYRTFRRLYKFTLRVEVATDIYLMIQKNQTNKLKNFLNPGFRSTTSTAEELPPESPYHEILFGTRFCEQVLVKSWREFTETDEHRPYQLIVVTTSAHTVANTSPLT